MPQASQRDRILDAAVRTLHERGFNGCGVQDITEAAGVAKGSFYNHFESKEALGVAALDRYFQERTCERLSVLSDETLAPLARLRRYFDNLAEMLAARNYASGCLIGNLSAELADQSRVVRDRLAAHFAGWARAIETCVREAQVAGEIRTDLAAAAIAAFLLNAWEGAILRARVERDGASFDAFRTVVFTALRP